MAAVVSVRVGGAAVSELATWVSSRGLMGMVPSTVSTSPVSSAEVSVALAPSARLTIMSWEREEAVSSAARRMRRRKVDMPSRGPTSMVMWSDPIASSVLQVVLLAGSVGNGGANGSASVCKVGRGG